MNITDAIFSRAEQQPHSVAVIDPARIIDYRTLCGAVCLAAQRFRQAGWKAGDTVGISLREDPALYLVSSLALARMGVTQTAVPASEPAPLRRARIERSGLCGLVADGSPGDIEQSMVTVAPEADWLKIAAASAAADDIREPGEERLWCITETSGTTATPKRIGISHEMEELRKARVESIFSHRPGERFVNLTGIRYLSALRRAICCLGDGGTVTFPPGFATGQLLDWIALHHVTYIICVPMHLHQLLRDIRESGPRLPALRILRSGTGALSPSAVQEVRRRISPNLYVSYGANESGNVAVATPTMLDAHPDTVGQPLPGVEVGVVDAEDRPVADGVAGHFRVRGPGVLASYLGAVAPEHARMFRNGWSIRGTSG